MGRHAGSLADAQPGSRRPGPRLVATAAAVLILVSGVVAVRTALASRPAPSAPSSGRSMCGTGKGCADTPATQLVPVEARLLGLVRAERAQAGCATVLRLDSHLMDSARAHAADMLARAYVDQVDPEHEGPQQRARTQGYLGGVVEVLAAGLPNADAVFAQWTNPNNAAAQPVRSKLDDCTRVSAGIAYRSGKVRPSFGDGVWVLDMGDA